MLSEPFKIIFRRFVNRLTESGLLIISVALGVGAFAAGGTLFVNVVNQNNELLNSPTYKEIVVSTRENKDSMEVPVKEKLINENAILTESDLLASQMIPSIGYSYIMNKTRLRMINEETQNMQEKISSFPKSDLNESSELQGDEVNSSNENQSLNNTPPEMMSNTFANEDLTQIMEGEDIVMSEDDEVSGYEVTSQFFDAWNLTTSYGSLFSSSDYSQTNSLVILGNDLAKTLVNEGEDLSSLIGKRLLAMQGYQTIIGILEDTGTNYDYEFFTPYSDNTSSGSSGFKKMFMNSELRFAVTDPQDLESVSQTLDTWFTNQYGENQIIVSNPRLEAEQTVDRNSGISLLLLVLALSGLFISSVNISHILLSRTLRMKRHVGILMALGATKKNINYLFSMEALLIIIIGSALGILIAVPINIQMQSALALSDTSNIMIIISALVSAIIIFTFTIIPIRRFDKIKPADAMRVR